MSVMLDSRSCISEFVTVPGGGCGAFGLAWAPAPVDRPMTIAAAPTQQTNKPKMGFVTSNLIEDLLVIG